MSHKRDTRRVLALGRRKEDVEMYKRLQKVPVPKALYGVIYKDQSEWDKLINRKFKLAQEEVETLNTSLIMGRRLSIESLQE